MDSGSGCTGVEKFLSHSEHLSSLLPMATLEEPVVIFICVG